MPRYDFRCTQCGHEFELRRNFSEAGDPAACPLDGAPAGRQFSAPMMAFGAGEDAPPPAEPSVPHHGHVHSHGPGGRSH